MHLLRQLGFHPLVAFSMICVDVMLTAADLATAATVSVIVAAILTVPCILLQRYAYKDAWPIAVSKGLIVGILTAIPTPLPSVITGTGGVLGTIGLFTKPKELEAAKDENQKLPGA